MKQGLPSAKEAAEGLAIQALTFIAGDGERLGRFLAVTGIGPQLCEAIARSSIGYRYIEGKNGSSQKIIMPGRSSGAMPYSPCPGICLKKPRQLLVDVAAPGSADNCAALCALDNTSLDLSANRDARPAPFPNRRLKSVAAIGNTFE